MSSTAVLICVFGGLIISIIINNKLGHNIGLWALAFAYFIGCWGLGLKPSDLVKYWPTTFSFVIVSLSIFYGYASQSGAMFLLARKIIYANRKRTWILPILVFILGFALALTGCSTYTVTGLLAPIGYDICLTAGINPILIVPAVMIPSAVGSFAPWAGGAAQGLNYFASTQWADLKSDIQWCIWGNSIIVGVIAFIIIYLLCKGWKAGRDIVDIEKPGEFSAEQKKVLWVIGIVAIIVILPAILKLFGVKPKWFNYLDIQFVAILGAIVFKFMNIGGKDAEKDIITKKVPWGMLFMVVGVTTLMNVGKTGGAIDLLAGLITEGLPTWLIPAGLCTLAGIMSFFAGGMTVVIPTLLALVEPLYGNSGLSPIIAAGAIYLGANLTAVSPVSTGGSIILGLCPDEQWRQKQFKTQFALAFYFIAVDLIFALLGGFGIFQLSIFK